MTGNIPGSPANPFVGKFKIKISDQTGIYVPEDSTDNYFTITK